MRQRDNERDLLPLPYVYTHPFTKQRRGVTAMHHACGNRPREGRSTSKCPCQHSSVAVEPFHSKEPMYHQNISFAVTVRGLHTRPGGHLDTFTVSAGGRQQTCLLLFIYFQGNLGSYKLLSSYQKDRSHWLRHTLNTCWSSVHHFVV
jgi:hypothetical protein